MKKLFIIAVSFIASSYAFAQGVMKFEKEEHDFGDIKEGTIAEYSFKFKNTGNAPIVITNVQASCGCTTPEWPKEPVMPGETAIIKAAYNSKSRPGNFFKTITITSNATEPTKIIKIKGNVVMPDQQPSNPQGSIQPQKSYKIEFKPNELHIGRVQVGSTIIKKVNFQNLGEAPFSIRSLSSTCNCVTLKSPIFNIQPGSSGSFELVYYPTKSYQGVQTIQVITDVPFFTPTFQLHADVVESIITKSLVQETSPIGW
ncbi:MAG: DUF1573 domain-containing protein [Cytophagales bacterium]|nr:DUF1573 domain-containing protein [Cytophagales bacterium]MDW8384117.1 DUF1573 domain-containing protein [Flammeovirgaceae bacterium]